MSDKLLTVAEVAEQLTVAISTVFSLVDQGLLVAVNITPGKKRRTLRFQPAAVAEFLDRQKVVPVAYPLPPPRREERLAGDPKTTLKSLLSQARKASRTPSRPTA